MRDPGSILGEDDLPRRPPAQVGIEPEMVRVELARIMASSDFKAAERNRRFLRYVVEEALAGRGARIKAYNIAVSVLGRDESFDPQTDPIVRIEASRLRRSLEHYYILGGQDDLIRIEIPKGGYLPAFGLGPRRSTGEGGVRSEPALVPELREDEPPNLPEHREAAASHLSLLTSSWRMPARKGALALGLIAVAPAIGLWVWTAVTGPDAVVEASSRGPSIVVLPFENLSGDPDKGYVASGMTEEITTGLAQFHELFVYAPETGARYDSATNYEKLHRELGVRYILEGSVRHAGEVIRVTARLVDATSGIQLWASAYEEAGRGAGALFDLQNDIARNVVIEVAQPYGVIATADMKLIRGKAPESLSAYECVLQVIDYYRHMSPRRVEHARGCLERTTASEPYYADAWALLSMSYLDHVRLRIVPISEDGALLEQTLHAARRAVELAPRSALAHLALLLAYSFQGEIEQAVAAGERAVALNPNNSDILAGHGMRLTMMGQWERGLALLDEAFARNPAHPGWYHAAPAINSYRQGRYVEALEDAKQIAAPDWIHNHVILAMIYGQLGQNEAAEAAARKILEMDPEFEQNVRYELQLRNFPKPVGEHMIEGLRKAGLSIPEEPREAAERRYPVTGRPRKVDPASTRGATQTSSSPCEPSGRSWVCRENPADRRNRGGVSDLRRPAPGALTVRPLPRCTPRAWPRRCNGSGGRTPAGRLSGSRPAPATPS